MILATPLVQSTIPGVDADEQVNWSYISSLLPWLGNDGNGAVNIVYCIGFLELPLVTDCGTLTKNRALVLLSSNDRAPME